MTGEAAMPFRIKNVMFHVSIQLLLAFFFAVSSLTSLSASTSKRDYWPTEHWQHSTPEAQGLDSEKLLRVIPFIIENLPNIQSLFIVRNGYVIFENYYGLGMPDRQDTVHSVTKSITSVLVGIAKDQGLIGNLNQTLYDILPEYFDHSANPAKKKITLTLLLTMTAVLQPVRVKDWNLLMQWNFAHDRTRFSLGLPLLHSPGQKFAYSNPISHLLSVVVIRKSGVNLAEFAEQNLFKPLGIKPRVWKMDAQGYSTGHGGLYLSTRDMVKIGFLYLNDGYWDGKQIVSPGWVEESTRGHVTAGRGYYYGYQWWIRPVGGCPSYRAWGRNGQFIVVVPELDLVVAVTSGTGLPGGPSGHYAPLFDIVAKAVIDKNYASTSSEEVVFSGDKNLPADLKKFFQGFSQPVESKNIEGILDCFSDSFLNSRRKKPELISFYGLLIKAIDEYNLKVDQCRIKGNMAKISGEIETKLISTEDCWQKCSTG
ncbi:MAG: serine hydrolase [bacterium]|nr:serine hydrolase [bacterium]